MERINLNQSLLVLILLFIPVNLLKDLFPFPITIVIGGLVFIVILGILKSRMTKRRLMILIVPFIISIFNIFVTDNIVRHIRYFINWYALLCVLLICMDKKNIEDLCREYVKSECIIHRGTLVVAFLYVILLFTPSAYSGGWWGLSNGFVAYTVSHAVAASTCTFAIYAMLYLVRHKRIENYIECGGMLLIALYAVFQTGARVYVISIGVVGIFFLFRIITQKDLKIFVLILAICFIAIIWADSAFVEKSNIVLTYQEEGIVSLLSAFTSGRTDIWRIDLLNFIKGDVWSLLGGKGFSYSYYINKKYYYGFDIFSHNIFIETLLSMGIIGEAILLFSIKKCLDVLGKDIVGKIVVILYVIVVGFLNGLFDSQVYCFSILLLYMCITLCRYQDGMKNVYSK